MRKGRATAVGDLAFSSLSELRRYVDRCVADGEIDQGFAAALVARHAYAPVVIAPGIAAVRVVANSSGGRSLAVERVDGTRITLKRSRCIDETEWVRFVSACRLAVFDDIRELKRQMFAAGEVHCALTGEALSWDTCDLDHAPPATFAGIARGFAGTHGQSPTQAKSRDYDAAVLISAEAIAAFRRFHAEHARLRPVARAVNRGHVYGYARPGDGES